MKFLHKIPLSGYDLTQDAFTGRKVAVRLQIPAAHDVPLLRFDQLPDALKQRRFIFLDPAIEQRLIVAKTNPSDSSQISAAVRKVAMAAAAPSCQFQSQTGSRCALQTINSFFILFSPFLWLICAAVCMGIHSYLRRVFDRALPLYLTDHFSRLPLPPPDSHSRFDHRAGGNCPPSIRSSCLR